MNKACIETFWQLGYQGYYVFPLGIPVEANAAYVPTPSIPVEANVAYVPTPSIPVEEANAAYKYPDSNDYTYVCLKT